MSLSDAPPETAVELFRALRELLAQRRLALRYDYKRLQHIDCPVASEADGNVWAYTVLVVVLLAFWLGGWRWALSGLALGALLYITLAKTYIRRRIRHRIDDRALQSLDDWQRLWRFGGVALLPDDASNPCNAPKGNWMELVRRRKTGN